MSTPTNSPATASPVAPSLGERTIAILGGTGPQGRGLARRFAIAGLTVVIGSRDIARAVKTAHDLAEETGGEVSGASNADAAAQGDPVLVVVPWDAHAALVKELSGTLAGKVVIDCVNPLVFDKSGCRPLLVEEGSAVQQAQQLLPDSTVVGAFNTVSAALLNDPACPSVDTDVLVIGDDRAATDLVAELASVVPGMRGIYGGRQVNAHQIEALTANLISINRRYKSHAGIRVTDL